MNHSSRLNSRIGLAALTALIAFAPGLSIAALPANPTQSDLERELKRIETEINSYQKQVTSLRGQRNSLANKIAELNAERGRVTAEIEATEVRLKVVAGEIQKTHDDIASTIERTENTKDAVSEIIRNMYRQDRTDFVMEIFTSENFGVVADDMAASRQINARLFEMLAVLKKTDETLRERYDELAERQLQQESYLAISELQVRRLAETVGEQRTLLDVTKGKETQYQSMLGASKQKALEIKNRIYELLAAERVTFGQAVAIAQWASKQTGVRASFLLAVLTQESNLGKNVGTCNRKGDPASKSWKVIMKPERDHEPFKTITKELGKDPDVTPVSCPMRNKDGSQLGWGGAMGPAQFIPSTWMSYRGKVTALTGKAAADPWDIRDAFAAAAIKLKADGGGSVSGEWSAAMRYFSGGTNPAYRFYGDNVVATAEKYQRDIETLSQ